MTVSIQQAAASSASAAWPWPATARPSGLRPFPLHPAPVHPVASSSSRARRASRPHRGSAWLDRPSRFPSLAAAGCQVWQWGQAGPGDSSCLASPRPGRAALGCERQRAALFRNLRQQATGRPGPADASGQSVISASAACLRPPRSRQAAASQGYQG